MQKAERTFTRSISQMLRLRPTYLLAFFMLLFYSRGVAQRSIDFYEPDFDKSYCAHILRYGKLLDAAYVPPHYAQFYSRTAAGTSCTLLEKRLNSKKEVCRFNKDGFLVSWKPLNAATAVLFSYNMSEGRMVVEQHDTMKNKAVVKRFVFNNKQIIDSVVMIYKDKEQAMVYTYDTAQRVTGVFLDGYCLFHISYTQMAATKGMMNRMHALLKDHSPEYMLESVAAADSTAQMEVMRNENGSQELLFMNSFYYQKKYDKAEDARMMQFSAAAYQWNDTQLIAYANYIDAMELALVSLRSSGYVIKNKNIWNCNDYCSLLIPSRGGVRNTNRNGFYKHIYRVTYYPNKITISKS